jgi:hypothetical protein
LICTLVVSDLLGSKLLFSLEKAANTTFIQWAMQQGKEITIVARHICNCLTITGFIRFFDSKKNSALIQFMSFTD